jgi:serine/threonine protein kinase
MAGGELAAGGHSRAPGERGGDEAWKTYAESIATTDIGETVTARHYAAGPSGPDAAELPPASAGPDLPTIKLPELPYIPIAKEGAPPAELDAVDFEVTGVLGEGGMGRVLLARQRSLRRDVALKVIKAEVSRPDILDALLAEAVVTGSLEHPSIVPVHALGRDAAGRPVLAMKRIEGVSWRDLARDLDDPRWASVSSAPESEDRLDAHLEIFMAVCNAVSFAHSRGIVHRDIKLDNVMIGGFGEVYVVDWGIATRAASPGEESRGSGPILGTPSYLAPEMVRGDLAFIDARTDVYLLGATLHAALTGRPRHAAPTLVDALISARDSAPVEYGPEVPAELGVICNKAMSREAKDRFQSALDLRRAVASFRRHRGSIALTEQAASKLAEARALVAARAASPEQKDDPRVHVLMTESRFGFMHALLTWSENAAAKAGLEECLEVMIQHELAQRDAEGARALYAELARPRPDLARRIEALEADLSEASAREARLLAMERDADLSVGARAQMVVVGIVVLGALGISTLVAVSGYSLSERELLAVPVVGGLAVIVGAAIVRRHLRTSISRRAIGMVVLLCALIAVHRAFVIAHGPPDIAPMLQGDLAIGLGVFAAMSLALVPRMAWVCAPFVLGAVATALWPDRAMQIFAITKATALALMASLWVLSARSRRRSP